MLFKVTLVCVAVTLATVAAGPLPKCPEFAATTDLDLEKYAEGKWYLLAKTENEQWDNCTEFETKLSPEKIKTKHYYNNKGYKVSFDFPFEVDVEKGRFTFPSVRIDGEPVRTYVKTDYEHYSLNYGCQENPDGSIVEFASLKVRQGDLATAEAALENAKKLLADSGSKLTELHSIKRENCPQ